LGVKLCSAAFSAIPGVDKDKFKLIIIMKVIKASNKRLNLLLESLESKSMMSFLKNIENN
jgi:hypothetical protein